MDAHLKRLAEISLALDAADEALADEAHVTAREHLDDAAAGLDALRNAWPTMTASERGVVGRTAAPLRSRLDAARRRLPTGSGARGDVPVAQRAVDDEQERDPDAPRETTVSR